jgi:hypothetical protein
MKLLIIFYGKNMQRHVLVDGMIGLLLTLNNPPQNHMAVFGTIQQALNRLKNTLKCIPPIKPYCTYLYRNKVLVITKVTTQDTPKLVSKELCHRLYRNLKLPTNIVRQSTATSQFNRSPRVAPNAFKQLVIVQKHTLTPTRIIKPPISSVREVPPRRLP